MRILTSSQMREADRRTIEEIGIPAIVLMENAGRQVVAALEAVFDDLAERRVAVLCGRGNNGGDGFVVARTLHQRGIETSVFVIGSIADIRGEARVNLEILGRIGLSVVEIGDEQAWELHFSEISSCSLIVDALFGTGLKTPLQGMLETVAADINGSGIPVAAIDLPSGLSADTHELIGSCIDATVTVTLAAPKIPLVLPPAELHAGDIVIADIGIPQSVIDEIGGPRMELLTRASMRALVTPRSADSHKGDYGHVLVVAGSRGRTGAAHLSAMAALRSGAGLVTIATPASCQPVLAAMAPEYMTIPLAESGEGLDPAEAARLLDGGYDVIALGPGLGTAPGTRELVYAIVERAGVPLVLDADALNVFTSDPHRLVGSDGRDVIITPHPGEFARLMGVPTTDVQANRVELARTFAARHRVYVVLKGHRTVIAAPDERVFINPTGNPGMATGGMGDVLTGMIAAWLGQLLDAEAACRLGVYLHGAAGDLAEAAEGEVALTASDLLAHLGDAVLELTARRRVAKKPE
ncbi:MAG TPA: NAD(P)H-hydrate dehydratase [Vicinamibacterales bacterium]|nr:NAD(P)H-hydrate dehydratase [Vicinamibacterales bacterium]